MQLALDRLNSFHRRQVILIALAGAFAFELVAPIPSSALVAAESDLSVALSTINQVGEVGAGHEQAMQAWKKVASATAEQLPTMLRAIERDKPLAANWIRGAVDQIAEDALRLEQQLPVKQLEAVVFDPDVAPRARRLAFEWLAKIDPTAEDRIVPQMANDSSVEMRRDAVARLLTRAESLLESDNTAAKSTFRDALTAARDTDQIEQAADKLREMDEQVDLPRHFGFLIAWKLMGPFNNRDQAGFDVAYPPESELDASAEYPGQKGAVRWIDHNATDKYGMVNLNDALGKHKGAAAYAWSVFQSETDQEVDLRLGCINANKVWINGQLAMSNEVYHAGNEIDQYRVRAKLKQGDNTILLKICQNEQTQPWAQDWEFQFRICDEVGTAILSTDR